MFVVFCVENLKYAIDEAEGDKYLQDLLELICDIDDHYQYHQSMLGTSTIGFLDIVLLSFLRRNLGLKKAQDIYEIAYPVQCHNLFRVLDHIMNKYPVGYDAMDKKEEGMMEKISLLTSSRVFIEAIQDRDIEKCRLILKQNPRSINSIDVKNRNWSAVHFAVSQKNWKLLEFLKEQKYVDFNMSDFNGETPLYEAIKILDIDLVKYLVEECKVDIEHREV